MPNPTVNFRLSPYQIARGLWIVRKLEPAYKPTSVSQLVKILYLDYLAKMSYGRSDIVPLELLEEVKKLLSRNQRAEVSFEDFIELQEPITIQPAKYEQPNKDSKSTIRSVSDFSPPADWLINDE